MYIDMEQVQTLLNLGRAIEQWIGVYREYDYTAIKWLRIKRNGENTYDVIYSDVIDDGDENFNDVYEFTATDPDFTYGKIDSFQTAEEAINFALEQYGCKPDKFVGSGMIQEEYAKYLKKGE